MSGIHAQNCAVAGCVSGFPYKDECALVKSGCCAREMLSACARNTDGLRFPMDLAPGGNPFVNALKAEGFVLVADGVTRLSRAQRQEQVA